MSLNPLVSTMLVTLVVSGCRLVAPSGSATDSLSGPVGTSRFEALVDPAHGSITISPVGMRTLAADFYVTAVNAVWSPDTTIFSFDLRANNATGGTLSNVRGEIIGTTPAAPTILLVSSNGTTMSGRPYYDYGSLANGATGSATWRFSDPSATPFRFGFTMTQGGSATDLGPLKNKAPVVAANPSSAVTVNPGNTTPLVLSATDPNGDNLTYQWSAPSGGTITGSGASVTYQAPYVRGTYPIVVTVDDSKGGTTTNTFSVTVPNSTLVTNGLRLHLDAGDPASYPGSGTGWTDLTGNGLNGVLTNGPMYSGVNGGTMVFDGANDYVNVNSGRLNYAPGTTGALSLEIWCYPTGPFSTYVAEPPTTKLGGLFGQGYYNNTIGWGLGYIKSSDVTPQDQFNFQVRNMGTILTAKSSIPSLNNWYHVVGTFTRNDFSKLYVNGALVKSISSTPLNGMSVTPSVNDASIGGIRNTFFTGCKLPIARLYDRDLSAAEVFQNYDAQRDRFGL